MTKRKFTPPTKFPAEYENGFGDKITLLVKGVGEFPYAGQYSNDAWQVYKEDGSFHVSGAESKEDLHDIPKKQVHWANDYNGSASGGWWLSRKEADLAAQVGRIAVIRREWVEGELPQYFVEEV